MTDMYVTMTPIHFDKMKTIRFERTNRLDQALVHHVAGGQHAGIIVNKEVYGDSLSVVDNPEMQLEFTCVMYNSRTAEMHAETRRLKFWFTKGAQQYARLDESYAFFRELVNPDSFPRDYTGFIKKVLKQLHGPRFPRFRRVDLDIIPLDKQEQEALVPERERRPPEQVLRDAVQMRLEEAYPNILSMDELVRILDVNDRKLLELQLEELEQRDLVQLIPLEGKNVGFRRKIHLRNQEVKEVKGTNNMQQVSVCEKPTIAIITNLLCEKLAVDAMIEQKTTFVRYRTEGGESHVYTIGSIGPHRVISTKLPMVGSELKAKISSASITTRLLGAFQAVQHVFLVGVGGSVPHVYEFEKHSRLGDVVVSAPVGLGQSRSPNGNGNHANKRGCDPVYIYCDRLVELSDDLSSEQPFKFVLKQYEIRDSSLLDCVGRVLDRFEQNPNNCQWAEILTSSMKLVSEGDAVNFDRPPSDTDKLKLKVDQGVTFDIKHPEVPENLVSLYPPGIPAVRLGCLGSGRPITDNDQLRDSFAKEHQLLCYDSEYDQVLESVLGNGLNSFLIIRGMADYVEGRRNTQWQPYAALAAASFMKAVILELPPCRLDED
ncbi:hypothetical protein EG68_02401 [Paragonimus skrjabini miyazakii]|uniref:Nucleoside phosphorylase domain-containing protein n=1 Tax=Paragonimus skrjabini miyazakii TaxID=59628 RepID=A0A8S9Z9L0_9TREM|nr:hypothetical protein EG68_02401 [Paragonimus skrjabini miyazakii]